jgi:hypothetical protein
MFTHQRAIAFADFLHSIAIFILVGDVNDQASDHSRLTSGLRHDSDHISERAIKLFNQIVADNLLLVVPRDLACNKQDASAGVAQSTVGITTRGAERFRIDQAYAHFCWTISN